MDYITTPYGLQYKDDVVGTGKEVPTRAYVTVHYTGWLKKPDGSKGPKFDSSKDRNEPMTFPLGAGRVIRGWDLGLPGMKMGGTRTLVVPAELAYGTEGDGSLIPPNCPLIFEIEMLYIQ